MTLKHLAHSLRTLTGISSKTGAPFSPPVDFRTTPRPDSGAKERKEIIEGLCHKCDKWIPLQGVKNVEVIVKELAWYVFTPSLACGHDRLDTIPVSGGNTLRSAIKPPFFLENVTSSLRMTFTIGFRSFSGATSQHLDPLTLNPLL